MYKITPEWTLNTIRFLGDPFCFKGEFTHEPCGLHISIICKNNVIQKSGRIICGRCHQHINKYYHEKIFFYANLHRLAALNIKI